MSAAEQTMGKASFLASSVGRKVIMAVTGLVLFGFVTVHMLGNLTAYMGPEAMNAYAQFLHEMLHGMGIWIFRGVMLLAVGLHGWAATTLTLDNLKARPKGYREQQLWAATLASRTMRWSGFFLAGFVVYHLLHLTTGQAHPQFEPGMAYENFVTGFKSPGASAVYILAMLCLGLHMWHGVWSMTQTFGLSHPRFDGLRRVLASLITVAVVGVNISYPIAVLAGFIH